MPPAGRLEGRVCSPGPPLFIGIPEDPMSLKQFAESASRLCEGHSAQPRLDPHRPADGRGAQARRCCSPARMGRATSRWSKPRKRKSRASCPIRSPTPRAALRRVMAMNNVYYRFVHLASNPEYGKMPARLRMNFIGSHGIAKEEFELFSLAVSAMNGCGMCIDSHERVLLEHGVKPDVDPVGGADRGGDEGDRDGSRDALGVSRSARAAGWSTDRRRGSRARTGR